MRRRAKIIHGKQIAEGVVLRVAKWILVEERLVLVKFSGPFECFPALFASIFLLPQCPKIKNCQQVYTEGFVESERTQ